MATELATGYLSLVAETKGVKKAIEAAFGDSEKAATAAGEKAGKAFTDAAHKKSKAAGRATGRSFGDAMDTGLRQSMPGARWLDDFARQARASGNPVGFTVGRALGGAVKAGLTVGIAGAATVVASAIGATGYALSKGFQRLKTIDTAEFQLKALGYSLEEVGRISKDVTDVVTGTPIALEEAFGSAVMFLGAGVEQGDELNRILTAIADAAGFSGSSFQDLAIIFSQVMNMGTLQAGDLLQLHQRNIPVQKWIQKELQITAEEYADMSREGQISMEHLLAAVENNIGGMAKRMGETLEGSLSNLRTAAARTGASLITALSGGDIENTTDGINSITEAIDALNEAIKLHQPEIVEAFGAIGEAAIGMAALTADAISRTLIGFGELVGGVGNAVGFLNKYVVAPMNDLMGRSDIADELRRQAEEQFAWGEGMKQAGDNLKGFIDSIESGESKWRNHIENTKQAAIFTRDLGDAIKKAQAASDGGVILKAPTAAELNKIDEAKYRIEAIPDSADFRIVPQTDEAEKAVGAWREKEAKKAAEVPVDADAKPAEESTGAWRTDEEGRPVRIVVDPQLDHASAKMNSFIQQWSSAIIAPTVQPDSSGAVTNPLTAPLASAGVNTSGAGYPALTAPGAGSPSISEVDAIAKQFGLTKTSGHRPGDPGYHGQGLAGDYAGSVENMQKFAAYMAKNYGGHLNELIFDAPGWGANVKNGKIVGPFGNVYTLQQAGRHDDHVHIAVRGRASGGAVFGPGTGTSDSIPAWLSNGEHVIPADEVKKAGGQGAIYHLRALLRAGELPGFNRGGAVDQRKVREAQDRIADYQQRVAIAQQELQELEPDAKPSQRLRAQQELSKYQRLFKQAQDDYWVVAQGGTPMSRTAENRVFDADAAVELAQTQLDELLAGGDVPESRLMEARFGVDQAKREAAQAREDLAAAMEQRRQQQQQTAARTEGYIPAAAGSTAVAGKSAVSGFINMGAEVINSLIDQAASAASTAAAAGITAGSMGAGAPGGAQAGAAAAQFAIGLGANAAKRGVSYGFQMAGIGVDTLLEHLTPFGAPRWLTHDYSGFMPRFDLSPEATTTLEEMQSAVDPNTTVHGQAQGAPPGPVVDPMESFTSMMTSLPEPVEPPPQPPMFHVDNIHAADAEDVGRQLTKQGKLWMMQYGSRP